ncbi:hypothetical protein A3A54_02310 [Candidatus Curtissbacteria bacterium RIFCSPLOWO2_01_FULL_39_62]|uniref:Uncharacterized protein n=2 Tax=Candidatus Curtissiibacteriota TaxID=1752717 RepID=A0A1F5G8U6_9BACT|nr:MAG: hypothetical protein A2775_02710 [Candidatus Curtissbacteria bacterium RIFCSPHIGHO2_01_FULL_39_57]OGD88282.1 MAG: hypothetical protein A3D04_00685 [Candidatus Curtissbacteria bacterium RIFCSPHIGHO2_02_FULL_40_16b]OGD90346.1 MAG: hypothetical protein A3E11_00695 [Candidatus Curtissbacteria bacterium RIFCSPHIGHO2_12_FULL_38_37]OGE00070.1 MAG: hypothetical protein A3J17_05290 [Candidatus Curtissbacteria bacterium RIFCSPLOWO2_02_FULL_40_11]OGE00584.1 MAG: hypothetical protein A3A54_02310 [C
MKVNLKVKIQKPKLFILHSKTTQNGQFKNQNSPLLFINTKLTQLAPTTCNFSFLNFSYTDEHN